MTEVSPPMLDREDRNPEGIGFLALVHENFQTHGRIIFSQGFWAVFWHRFGNWRMGINPLLLWVPFSMLYRVGAQFTQWLCGIDLPYTVRLRRRVRIEHFGGMILIAEGIGKDVIIRQNTTFSFARVNRPHARSRIGNGVDIGAGAMAIGAINIGDRAVIGANSVVTRDVPAGATMEGVPAWKIGQK